ncbi:DUF5666 domain-containing protein [Hydrogenophaga sp. 5NK40-0174]|uniref:DUF5666 domain-containing protein n=1 Tax=Hydrogenophaga sp. 5NK40-0174 TaxID=3127649 RepID=UPI00310B1C97
MNVSVRTHSKSHRLARLAAAVSLVLGMAACGGSGSDEASIDADPKDGDLTGLVTSYTDATHFSVEGVPVDATGAAAIPANLAQGSYVEVEGAFVDGTLVADSVKYDDDHCDDDDRDDDCSGHVEDDELEDESDDDHDDDHDSDDDDDDDHDSDDDDDKEDDD